MNISTCNMKSGVRGKRCGSALLIVLGFLSFMVVSAVSFAIYMRSERMPSSVFRRDVQARHLVKAGLARAISEIDDAIREDPFPVGVERGWAVRVNDGSSSPSGTALYETSWMKNKERQTRTRYFNRWLGRVFMPPNPDDAGDYGLMAPSSQTTPVLNLEALGYLPPAVANDVRVLSRGTWSAKWKNFDYGAGRYAYCAVDVSDFFDINRVSADTPRTSQDHINIAHLFADDRSVDKGISSGDINAFADFVHDNRGTDSSLRDYPFVSMMDYNLALGAKGGVSEFLSPFYLWLGRSTSPSDFYADIGDLTSTSRRWLRCKNAFFITDSWLPGASGSYRLDISGNGKEPFSKADVESQNFQLNDSIMRSSDFTRYFVTDAKFLSEPDKCSLYDYLDRDDVPLSLCLPCVERVPMVAAIQPSVGFKLSVQAGAPQESTEGTTKHVTTDYTISDAIIPPNCELTCAVAFPFRHGRQLNGTFRAKAFMRVFLAEAGIARRCGENNGSLAALRPPDSDLDWASTYDPFKLGNMENVLAFTLVSGYQNITPSSVEAEADIPNNIVFRNFTVPNTTPTTPFFSKRESQEYTAEGVKVGDPKTEWKLNYSPLKVTGEKFHADAGSDSWMEDSVFQGLATAKFVPYVAVWVRIENSNGDVVDLVPAMPKDDQLNNGDTSAALIWNIYSNLRPLKDNAPFLLFATDASANPYTLADSMNGTPYDRPAVIGTWSPGALLTFDPRFNYAPEDWYEASGQGDLGGYWLSQVTDNLGTQGRDDDPFLFVSNQGYLQSLGELAFLPRLSNFRGDDNSVSSASCRQATKTGNIETIQNLILPPGFDGNSRTAISGLASYNCMWKSYRVFPLGDGGDMNKYGSDGLLRMSDVTEGGHGFRVDPYTALTNVMFAALANTPYDWWAAGTNKVSAGGVNSSDPSAKQNQLGDIGNSLKFAFNESGDSDTRLEYKDLRKIATYLMRRFEEAAAVGCPWQDMFDNLDWAGTAGQSLSDLYGDNCWPSSRPTLRHSADGSCSSDPLLAQIQDVTDSELQGGTSFGGGLTMADRKYLYAFWRQCFAHRQQLFLVFVRAESTAMGGSGEGQIPAQQGGRAVALVWRDPATPNGETGNPKDDFEGWVPHRTRILFYHQFD